MLLDYPEPFESTFVKGFYRTLVHLLDIQHRRKIIFIQLSDLTNEVLSLT